MEENIEGRFPLRRDFIKLAVTSEMDTDVESGDRKIGCSSPFSSRFSPHNTDDTFDEKSVSIDDEGPMRGTSINGCNSGRLDDGTSG